MSHGSFTVPKPYNEKVLRYEPGSRERQELKAELSSQSQQCVQIPLVINGEEILDRKTAPVTCPHKYSLKLADVAQASQEDVQQAIDSALAAREHWAKLPWQERTAVFLKAADLITGKYRAQMNAATMLGQSKTCYQAEIEAACELADFLRFNAQFAQDIYSEQPLESPPGLWNRSVARPLEGFVFAIAPFNFTAIALNLACAPALMGCSVILKPSPTAALSAHYGVKILEEAGLPPGVINVLNGDPKMIGDTVMKHKDLAGVHFTGSTATFKHLWKQVGQNIDHYRSYPRIVGETGGKDFVFVHPTANIDQVLTGLVRGAFEYQGQKCSAASRAYIPKSLWTELKGRLVEQVNSIKMGDPADFRNFMAAVIDKPSFNRINAYIEHARASSEADIICGGEYDQSQGYFIRPTVIETTNPQYKSMVEEIFGPILTVYVYPDAEIELAKKACEDGTDYALTGAIFARERRDISELTEYFENAAGNFYINDKPTGAVVGQQPFGGGRASGTNDKAGSPYNLLRWVSLRTIKENFLPITEYRYPHMKEE